MTARGAWKAAFILAVWVQVGCTGRLSGPNSTSTLQLGITGAHRLSADEYDNTLEDLLQDTTRSGFSALPQDTTDPFDNNYANQIASGALVDGAETLAINAAQRAVQNPAVYASLLPCTPQGPNDTGCFTQFVQTFGRRALRRPLSQDEVSGYVSLQSYAMEKNDFSAGVQLVIQTLLQDMAFLYRAEIGTPVDGLPNTYRLNDNEVATRLSYFLWGSTPPDWLLDAADAQTLEKPEQIQAAATRLLQDPHARVRVERFHALWFSYQSLPHAAALNNAMETESNALVDKVVFDAPGDYFDLFESPATFINDVLAQQYGLPSPGPSGFAWVMYGNDGRKGLISHGTFLSAAPKFGDTSPTRRGVFVRNRLLCQAVPPPPPTVNTDNPPTSPTSPCKWDRYASHRASGSCAGCHNLTDPIGFGLENFDQNGAYRTTDNGLPQCTIAGNGTISGVGDFHGPAGLADLLTGSGELEQCVTTQLFRFAEGRTEMPEDQALIAQLATGFKGNGRNFNQMLVDLVSDPSFSYRRDQ